MKDEMLLINVFLFCSLFVLWAPSFGTIVTEAFLMREDLQFFGYLINLYFQEAAPLQYRNVQGFDM